MADEVPALKLDSSRITMMFGSLRAGLQAPSTAIGTGSTTRSAASIQPDRISCDTAFTPERMKLEMWLSPWNGSWPCSGFDQDMLLIRAKHPPIPANEVDRETR